VPEAVTPICLWFANIREVIAKIGVAESCPATSFTARTVGLPISPAAGSQSEYTKPRAASSHYRSKRGP
jgi:hypothetical protein